MIDVIGRFVSPEQGFAALMCLAFLAFAGAWRLMDQRR